eukprot:1160432-Pelagomonas_calceolata.AAC.3
MVDTFLHCTSACVHLWVEDKALSRKDQKLGEKCVKPSEFFRASSETHHYRQAASSFINPSENASSSSCEVQTSGGMLTVVL